MKTLFFNITFLVFCLPVFTVTGQDNLAKAEIQSAIALAQGTRGQIDRQKAFEILQPYAAAGNRRAMNALGLIYINGYIATPDTVQAVYWLTQAAENGFSPAWDNLGVIYKYARGGVKMNFDKAFYCFEQSAKTGSIVGLYNAGYMLYKGFGCEQNYEKAFEYFTQSAEKNYSPAMYMLGLCYRNSYGTLRHEGNANYWLAFADKLAYKPATDEIEAETPENREGSMKIRSAQAIEIPAQHMRIKHLNFVKNMDGCYEGVLITYDWSGKHIIRETAIELNLVSDGKNVEGTWIENGDTVMLRAEQENDRLRFFNTEQFRSDHYTVDSPALFNFVDAEMQITENGSEISLNGNLTMFSPQTLEPERPMYIAIRRKIDGENDNNSTGLENATSLEKNSMYVYPVPFGNELNLSFTQTRQENVRIAIYDFAGGCVLMYDAGVLPAGEQRLTIETALPAGTYIVKLFTATRSEQAVVISKRQKK
jgi:hypothetical protein